MNIRLEEASGLLEVLTSLRNEFHEIPELGNQEFQTSERIESCLKELGLEVLRPFGTAVVGILRGGKPGKTLALRADMDALPLEENTGAACTSKNPGVMHACGHDIHITALLGAARLLSRHRDRLCGTVKFLFQPDEEGNGGAKRLVEAGCMEDVDAVFGAHVSPDLPLGHVGVCSGKFYAASDTFTVHVYGKSAHGAQRENGIDALAAAARMVTALLALPDGFDSPCVLSVGTLQAGSAINIIPDHAVFTGILRTLGTRDRTRMKQLFRDTIQQIARETNTAPEIILRESYPGVVNTPAMTELVAHTAVSLLGDDRVHILQIPTMTTEDFGYLIDASQGSFYHVGAGCSTPLHHPAFFPDPAVAVTAAAVHTAVAEAYLGQI